MYITIYISRCKFLFYDTNNFRHKTGRGGITSSRRYYDATPVAIQFTSAQKFLRKVLEFMKKTIQFHIHTNFILKVLQK